MSGHKMFWVVVNGVVKITTNCPADNPHYHFMLMLDRRIRNNFRSMRTIRRTEDINSSRFWLEVYSGIAGDQNGINELLAWLKTYERDCDIIKCERCSDNKILNECGWCKECCEDYAIDCPDCGIHSHRKCAYCEKCASCCTCIRCDDCGRRTDSVCENESFCSRCCGCSRMCTIPRPPEFISYDVDRGEKHAFTCKRHVGVEWEFNDCDFQPVQKWCEKWDAEVHHDGSCGWEAVTAPLAGDYISECLTGLGQAFERGSATMNSDCGIHVHVSAKDLNWEQMYNLLWVYALVEPMLYIIGGQERMNGEYCSPIGQKYKAALLGTRGFPGEFEPEKDKKIEILKTGSKRVVSRSQTHDPRFIKKDSGRYRGLNICPWFAGRARRKQESKIDRIFLDKLGRTEALKGKGLAGTRKITDIGVNNDTTVEFRIHEFTSSAAEVISWAQLCALIVEYSANATRAEILSLPKSPARALAQIAPKHKEYILKHLKEWRKEVRQEYRLITIRPGDWTCAALPDSSE